MIVKSKIIIFAIFVKLYVKNIWNTMFADSCLRMSIEKVVIVTSSPEMYLRFCGVSLRYFACVFLNSTVPRRKVYMIRAEMWGRETMKMEIQRDVYYEVDFSIAR